MAGEVAPADRSSGLIYGSGFESRGHLLRKLCAGRELFGNRPETVGLMSDPERFFPLLDRLRIRHPETRMTRPIRPVGWLAKQAGGAGGVQVRLAAAATPGTGTYYQRFEAGRTLSATFLANRNRSAILGFNQQWTTSARPELPYQFGGAVGGLSLPRQVRAEIAGALDRLVGETGLVGLNGLDFIFSGNRWSVLEVNPRPTATMELYDPDYSRGLFDWHLRSCKSELPERIPRPRAARALSIVSAAEAWESADDFSFPQWCRDLPRIGLQFSAGDPVCTVHAGAATPRAAVTLVRRRQARIQAMLAESAGVALR
jgi:predicted ATP-grasp superfamily ATP-dependent carboligase